MKKSLERFYPLIIFLFALLLYANTIPNEYNLDDELVTIDHRTTSKGFKGIPEIIKSFYYEDEMGYKYGYRPVTHITFAIEHQLFGENPHVGHAINVLLYAFLCLAIYYLTLKLAPDKGPLLALLVAMVFVAHPVHTEVVASIKNRDEILGLLLGIIAFLTIHWKYSKNNMLVMFQWLGAFLFFVLGAYSKSSILFFGTLIPLSYIIFSENKKFIFPILFLLSSGIVLFYQAQVTGFLVGFYLMAGLSLLMLAGFVKYRWWSMLTNFIVRHQGWFFTFFVILMLGSWVMLWFQLNTAHLVSNLLITGLGAFMIKDKRHVIALLFWMFLYGALITMINQELSFFVIFFFALLYLSESWLLNNKWLGIVLFVVAVVALMLFGENLLARVSLIALFGILITSYFRFSYGLILIVFLILANVILSGLFSVSNVLIILMTGIVVGVIILGKSKASKMTFMTSTRLLSVPLVLLTFLFVNEQRLNLLASEPTTIYEEEVIADNAVEVKEDRPLLLTENPIIENWDYLNRSKALITTYGFYLKKLLIPYPLKFYYGYNEIEFHDLNSWQSIVTFLFLLVLAFLSIFWFWKKKYLLSFSLLYFLLNIFLYANFLTPVAGIVGERLVFTASLGFSLLLGSFIYLLVNSKWAKLSFGIVAALVIVSAVFVINRNNLWKDKMTLFSHDIEYLGESAIANSLLAGVYMKKTASSTSESEFIQLSEKSLIHYNKAIDIYPDLLNWWFLKGEVEFNVRKNNEAIKSFSKSIEMDPNFSYLPYWYLGIIYEENSQLDMAIINYEKTLEMEPLQEKVYNNLTICYVNSNQLESAFETLLTGLSYFPNNYDINLNLGKLKHTSGNKEEALKYYKSARSIKNVDQNLTLQINLIERELGIVD